MMRTCIALSLMTVLCALSACDQKVISSRAGMPMELDEPPDAVVYGCAQAITGLPRRWPEGKPRWRDEAIVVGDFGFFGMAGHFYGQRRDRGADIQVKVPITIEGHSATVVWLPPDEQSRAGLILADVPRRGPANTYRLEDGHSAIRFEPCLDKRWTAWTAGLALADRQEITLMVKEDGAARATRVTLGPWQVHATGRLLKEFRRRRRV